MERRRFLKTLGGIFVAAAAPTKTFAFFGDILRPRPAFSGGLAIKAPIIWDYKRAHLEYRALYEKYWNLYAKPWMVATQGAEAAEAAAKALHESRDL